MKDKARILVYILIMLAAVLLITSFVRAAAPKTETVTVTVREGDTLWSLWERYGYGRADRWIDSVERANGMRTATLFPGDAVRIEVLR